MNYRAAASSVPAVASQTPSIPSAAHSIPSASAVSSTVPAAVPAGSSIPSVSLPARSIVSEVVPTQPSTIPAPMKVTAPPMPIPPMSRQNPVVPDTLQSKTSLHASSPYPGLQSISSYCRPFDYSPYPPMTPLTPMTPMTPLTPMMSVSSLSYPLSHINSDFTTDVFGGTLTPRVSQHLSAMGWDPSLCQLQRAPDSVNVLNNSVYETQGNVQPLMLPLQRVSSYQHELVHRTSLLSRGSMQKSPISDGNSQMDTTWMMATPQTIVSVPSLPIEKPEGLNSEVCFGDCSENEGHVNASSVPITPTDVKSVRSVDRGQPTIEGAQPMLMRVLSGNGEGDFGAPFDAIRRTPSYPPIQLVHKPDTKNS